MRSIGWVGSLVFAVTLLFSATALGQQQTGGIRGRVLNADSGEGAGGILVMATSDALQGEEMAVTEADGSFSLSLLPPGTYRLHFEGEGYRVSEMGNITVDIGGQTPVTVDLAPTQIEAAEAVQITDRAPALDQGSTAVGTTIDRDFLNAVPVGRRYETVLQNTPGASEDYYGTNIFGATGVENQYYVEGLNTTDIAYGRSGASMNTNFFEQIGIETAGYMPEFGRSTGGIFNLVLRNGSNEFHGDVFVNLTPGFLRANAIPIYRVGESVGRVDDLNFLIDGGFSLGGPIIRDRLWFYVGANPEYSSSDVDRVLSRQYDDDGDGMPDLDQNGNPDVREVSRQGLERNRVTAMLVGKLTLAITEEQQLSLSYFGNPYSLDGVLRSADALGTSNGLSGSPDWYNGGRSGGSNNIILNYHASFNESRFQVEAFAGYHTQNEVVNNTVDRPNSSWLFQRSLMDFGETGCPEDPNTPFTDCPVADYNTGGTGLPYEQALSRFTAGFRLTNLIDNHRLRYGADIEHKVFDRSIGYSGGYGIDEFLDSHGPVPVPDAMGNFTESGVRGFVQRAHRWETYATATEQEGAPFLYTDRPFEVDVATRTIGAFLQDSWEISRYITVNGGLRWDYERAMDHQGEGAVDIPDEFAPRLGLSVDPSGRGRMRLFANYGWYYEAIPLDMNVRSFSGEGSQRRFLYDPDLRAANGDFICWRRGTIVEDRPGMPAGERMGWVPAAPGETPENSDCTYDRPDQLLGGQNSPVVQDLNGQYHDEFMVGGEMDVADGWVVGVTGIYRRIQRVIEDVSPNNGQDYFIGNPGENDCDVAEEFREGLRASEDADGNQSHLCTQDTNGNGEVDDDDQYDAGRTVFPDPVRNYLGLVLSVRRRLSEHFQILASYTLSRTSGNYPGLYSADTGQLDPNISSQYDLISLLPNRDGVLPTDRTHVFKLAGSYEFGGLSESLKGLTLGLAYYGQSGIPRNYLAAHADYGRQEAFLLPRGSAGRTPFTHRLDATVSYAIPLGDQMSLSFNVNFFNILNSQRAEQVNDEFTTDVVGPQARGQDPNTVQVSCAVNDCADDPDGDGPMMGDDPDGDGMRTVHRNPTFGEAVIRQTPFNMRFGATLTF